VTCRTTPSSACSSCTRGSGCSSRSSADNLLGTFGKTQWIEPVWKAILSNKGILALLWEMYPDHPNLLPACLNGPRGMGDYVRKPLLSREGANVTLVRDGQSFSTGGDYGGEGFVYQQLFPLPNFEGNHPVVGSWVVGGEARGWANGSPMGW
jgi:glutathionylspermidine synthase